MSRKNMTPEERKAWGAKMAAARAAKKQNKQPRQDQVVAAEKEIEDSKAEAKVANDDVAALLKRIDELEKRQFFSQAPQPLARTVTKYSLRLEDYPDPRERLTSEPRLEQKAFKQNFLLDWEIRPHRYDAKDGVHYSEPGFRLKLWKRAEDPKTGELTDRVWLVQKATFFEDPDSAISCAHDKGINISNPEDSEYWNPQTKDFLDEMRYLRIRDWLFEIFWPSPVKAPDNILEEVFDNTLRPVKILETSSHDPQPIDFSKL